MKSEDWISINRLTPPSGRTVLGLGKSALDGSKNTISQGVIKAKESEYVLVNETDGLREVTHWQHIKLPKTKT
ncbi:MAG: hypothetical protein AAF363_14430 [Bacteroidota bacterium]